MEKKFLILKKNYIQKFSYKSNKNFRINLTGNYIRIFFNQILSVCNQILHTDFISYIRIYVVCNTKISCSKVSLILCCLQKY